MVLLFSLKRKMKKYFHKIKNLQGLFHHFTAKLAFRKLKISSEFTS